jgi:hypothetical protein
VTDRRALRGARFSFYTNEGVGLGHLHELRAHLAFAAADTFAASLVVAVDPR